MKFAPIVSEPYLWRIKHFELLMAEAPLVLESEGYRDWYRKRPDTHTLMLDNGAALAGRERAIDFDSLLEAAGFVNADEVVLPDVMYDSKATLELIRDHINDVPMYQRFLVPQGSSAREWLHCASELIQRYKFKVLGVPKHLDQLPGGRTHILAQLRERFPSIGEGEGMPQVHLLGIWGDPIEVLWLARRYPWVRSVDSSLPFAYALLGVELFEGWEKHGKVPFNYDTGPYDGEIMKYFVRNMHYMACMANGKLPYET